MSKINPKVDLYFAEGCGRCAMGGTPQCKVHNWQPEMAHLRIVLLDCGLTEEVKWSVPCYTFQNNNVIILAAFKEYCSLSFFKGGLLKDSSGILSKPGENSQAARLIKFTNVKQIIELEPIIKAYIQEAIEIEKMGATIAKKEDLEPIPAELEAKFKENTTLKAAFEALTQGRQRGYILHFSQPKQSKTREARIEKYIPKIMEGKGFFD
jgi:uncharacterized protein YdeI (YjbR/CyaY-like superfamily)